MILKIYKYDTYVQESLEFFQNNSWLMCYVYLLTYNYLPWFMVTSII